MAKTQPAKESDSKINDLIFKELIKRGYSLEGNTRVWNIADSKLWYLTPEQAQGYLDLESDQGYKTQTGQPQAEDLLEANITEIAEEIGDVPINIVDLGCGDGTKGLRIIELLRKINPSIKIRYCPIDISGYMVQKAIETVSNKKVDEIIEFQYNISDFENLENVTPLLSKGEYKKNVFLLLGNTLGNFEIHELLYEIRSSMNMDDLFIIDTAIDDSKQEERAEAYKKNKLANDWLIHIPLQLGLLHEEVELGTRWKNQRIELYYTIKVNKLVKFQNREISFNKGDQMIIAIAFKHKKEDLLTYFNMHFRQVSLNVSKDKSKALLICKK
ncbi:Histidine N-alpha-methyltransferase [uncultured archaeon]|nr:Histidine N-alpha-methyltransferase [uncultured archaeon]